MKAADAKHPQQRIKPAAKRKDYVRGLERKHEELELQNEALLQNQSELESSRDRYAEFFDAAPVCFVTFSRLGIIRDVNLAALQLLNHHHDRLTGWPFILFIAKEDRKVFLAHLSRCRDNSDPTHPMSVELQLARKPEEETVFIQLISTPAKLKSGSTVYRSVFMDITRQKGAARELEESLVREKTARQSAEAAGRAKDDFLATLSHELRTPLNPVLLLASESANDGQLSDEMRNLFVIIRDNVELEARLIDDLLDMTSIARGKMTLHFKEIDAQAVLNDAIAVVREQMEQKRIHLKLDFKAELHAVHADPLRLQQIFWNVLRNAVKFTPADGKIIVETFLRDKHLTVKIADSGFGMTPEELERIFSAFEQGDHIVSKKHQFGGLGLGLAISRKLIEFHHGHIFAESDGRDRGSTFTIQLPLSKQKPLHKNLLPPDFLAMNDTAKISSLRDIVRRKII